jgi:hypothetical protein
MSLVCDTKNAFASVNWKEIAVWNKQTARINHNSYEISCFPLNWRPYDCILFSQSVPWWATDYMTGINISDSDMGIFRPTLSLHEVRQNYAWWGCRVCPMIRILHLRNYLTNSEETWNNGWTLNLILVRRPIGPIKPQFYLKFKAIYQSSRKRLIVQRNGVQY